MSARLGVGIVYAHQAQSKESFETTQFEPMSSRSPRPFRFSSHDPKQAGSATTATTTATLGHIRQRTSSATTRPSLKDDFGRSHPHVSAHNPSHSTPPDLARPMTADSAALHGFTRRGTRTSILGAASDVLSARFLRRKSTRSSHTDQQPMLPKLVLAEVIRVVPAHIDEEERERQRLRDAAAQSVGIGLDLLETTSPTREESIYEDEDEGEHDTPRDDSMSLRAESVSHTESVHGRHTAPTPTAASSFVQSHRRRAGSLSLSQSRTASATPSPSVPPFPATLSSLSPFVQLAGTLPKHYPPPSLLMLALAKSWKSRHIVLSSPPAPSSTRSVRSDISTAPVSYIHLFRTTSPDERELERLEINENSVVFVTDEEVGSRRHIVKVGGLDVGAMRRDWNLDESGLTMVLLQIVDGAESRRWIAAIKTAILGQRSVRAGLGLPSYSLNGADGPRGDMDVVLSMRMQGILPSPVKSTFSGTPESSATSSSSPPTHSPSVSTHEDSITQPATTRSSPGRPASPRTVGGTVLSFKGLFTGSRPRSLSRSSNRSNQDEDYEDSAAQAESFGSVGSSLLGMQGPHIVKPHSMLPVEPPFHRRIVQNRTSVDWAPPDGMNASSANDASPPPSRAVSPPPLQPPPRRRAWTTSNEPGRSPTATTGAGRIYHHGNASAAGSFGVDLQLSPTHEESPSPSPTPGGANTPVGKPRAASVSSVSTLGTENVAAMLENANKRRWSRASSALPHRLTPPTTAGTPPPSSPPPASSSSSRFSSAHPYAAAERPPSSQGSSSNSTRTLAANLTLKRASMSSSVASSHSADTTSSPQMNSQTHSHTLLLPAPARKAAVRMSMPPPQRPAPSAALPPTPDQPAPPARPRSLSARPGTAPGASSSATTILQGASTTTAKPSLRDRALRLSLLPPKTQPPTDALPPRPDERPRSRGSIGSAAGSARGSTGQGHRRSASSGVEDAAAALVQRPPPTGPLPPTPTNGHAVGPTTPPSSPTIASAFKQRLRILSNSSSNAGASSPPSQLQLQHAPPPHQLPPQLHIAERITDPSFLVLAPTPTTTIETDLLVPPSPTFTSVSPSGDTQGHTHIPLLLTTPAPDDSSSPSSPSQTPPSIPPRSPLRPPPPPHSPALERESEGEEEGNGGVTALAPPPRRRAPTVVPPSVVPADKADGDEVGTRIRLPEEASADMGRGGAFGVGRMESRVSLRVE